MDFDLDDDERALRDGMREWAAGRLGSEAVRAPAATGGFDRAMLADLAQTGVFALRRPEGDGGLGLGMTHAAVVFAELGAALAPGPLVAMRLAAGVVDGAQDGTIVVTDVDRGARTLTHPAADVVVVVDEEGLWRVEATALGSEPVERPFDPLTPVAPVASLPRGDRIGSADDAARWRAERRVLTAATLIGLASGAVERMVRHANEREQFGRLIGSFQAIKHLCADALARTEVARAAVDAAACHLDGRAEGDADLAIAAAALLAAEAAVKNAKTSIQVHGGMGFTWEVDAHLHLKRATVLAARAGGTHENAERVAASI